MIALALLAAAIDGTPLSVLAPQALPAKGCAAYLFSGDGSKRFVAMASAEAGTLRLVLDGATVDATRSSQTGASGYGFAASTEYRGEALTATLDLTSAPRSDLTAGAVVPEATLTVDRAGKDGIVTPLVGIIGCAP